MRWAWGVGARQSCCGDAWECVRTCCAIAADHAGVHRRRTGLLMWPRCSHAPQLKIKDAIEAIVNAEREAAEAKAAAAKEAKAAAAKEAKAPETAFGCWCQAPANIE